MAFLNGLCLFRVRCTKTHEHLLPLSTRISAGFGIMAPFAPLVPVLFGTVTESPSGLEDEEVANLMPSGRSQASRSGRRAVRASIRLESLGRARMSRFVRPSRTTIPASGDADSSLRDISRPGLRLGARGVAQASAPPAGFCVPTGSRARYDAPSNRSRKPPRSGRLAGLRAAWHFRADRQGQPHPAGPGSHRFR